MIIHALAVCRKRYYVADKHRDEFINEIATREWKGIPQPRSLMNVDTYDYAVMTNMNAPRSPLSSHHASWMRGGKCFILYRVS